MLETWFVQVAFLVPAVINAVDALAAHLGGTGTIQRVPTIVSGHPVTNLVLATLSYLQIGVMVPLALTDGVITVGAFGGFEPKTVVCWLDSRGP